MIRFGNPALPHVGDNRNREQGDKSQEVKSGDSGHGVDLVGLNEKRRGRPGDPSRAPQPTPTHDQEVLV